MVWYGMQQMLPFFLSLWFTLHGLCPRLVKACFDSMTKGRSGSVAMAGGFGKGDQ